MNPKRKNDLARLKAQEEWGKWNTAPLANQIYGKHAGHCPAWLWDYAALAAGYGLLALKIYLIWRTFQ